MPLRLDNAIALPTCPQQPQKKKTGRSRDSRLTTRLDRCQRTSRPERLAAGRDQIGKVGDIVSESTGDFISESWATSSESARGASARAGRDKGTTARHELRNSTK